MKTQAWGWLMAGVLAAGLNAGYHDGSFAGAHRIADRIEGNSEAVLALATGKADLFLTEARLLAGHNDTASCPWSTAFARIPTRIAGSETEFARTETEFARIDALSARKQAQLDRWEASRDRIEARVAAETARLNIAATAFDRVELRNFNCPRLRVNVPQPARIHIAAPVIHIDAPHSAGPV